MSKKSLTGDKCILDELAAIVRNGVTLKQEGKSTRVEFLQTRGGFIHFCKALKRLRIDACHDSYTQHVRNGATVFTMENDQIVRDALTQVAKEKAARGRKPRPKKTPTSFGESGTLN